MRYEDEKVAEYIVGYLVRKEAEPSLTSSAYAREKNLPPGTFNSWLTGFRRHGVRGLLTDQQRAAISPSADSITSETLGAQISNKVEMLATTSQIIAALTALGVNGAKNRETESSQVPKNGNPDLHRVLLINKLLGIVQAQAMMADGLELNLEERHASWEMQFDAIGAGLGDVGLRMLFVRWQALRIVTPLQDMTKDPGSWPVLLAGAQAAIGLHLLLEVIAVFQDAIPDGEIETMRTQARQMVTSRDLFQSAADNINLLLDMLRSVDLY